MFIPLPDESRRTDDDCAALIWRRGKKSLCMNLNCYGGVTIRVGIAVMGSMIVANFEDAWKWFCDDSCTEL